jgi:CDP-diacylglycerol pyrophosphatase
MWLFTQAGMTSIVEDQDYSRYLIPRARIEGDLEGLFAGALIEESSATDYRYRTWLKRELVVEAVAKAVREIDYSNFKNSVLDRTRSHWYSSVWLAGADEQERRLSGKADRPKRR